MEQAGPKIDSLVLPKVECAEDVRWLDRSAAHATRAIPAIATIVAWDGCDHLGPVFEGDVLRTELRVEGASPLGSGGGTARLRALVSAERGAGERSVVLDWRFVALVA